MKEKFESPKEEENDYRKKYPSVFNLTFNEYLESLGLDPNNLDDDEKWQKHVENMKKLGIDIDDGQK